MSRLNWSAFLTALVLGLALAVPAAAHRPEWGDGRLTEVDDLDTSFAFYRELDRGEPEPAGEAGTLPNTGDDAHPIQIHYYHFEAQAGQRLRAGINIPALDHLEDYTVSMALVGPGLPAEDLAGLPVEAPHGMGALVFPTQHSEDFFEPFTQTQYWGRQSLDVELPHSRTYYLLVWNPEGLPGKYVLDVGRDEAFGPVDILRFPVWWLQVRWFFEQYVLVLFIAAAAVMALAALAVWWARRGKGKAN